MITKYIHHQSEVSVIEELKGRHREHCLCYQGCRFFKPGDVGNCHIASKLYKICVDFSMVTPVYECARYEK